MKQKSEKMRDNAMPLAEVASPCVTPKLPPPGWAKARVGKVVQLINGRAFKPIEWQKSGLPIVRIQNLNDPKAPYNYYYGELPEKFLLNDGDLLFAWSGTPGTSFGAHIWMGGKAWLNQHIFKVLFDEGIIDKKFLRFAINQNLSEYIRQAHGGAGLAHITKGTFENSELLLPPIAEQRQIVAEIEKQFTRLEAGDAALKRIAANLKRYRVSVLKAACEGKLVPTEAELARAKGQSYEPAEVLLHRVLKERREKWTGKGKYKEPTVPNISILPKLPEGWCWVTAEQLSDETRAITYGVIKLGSKVEDGIITLRSSDIRHLRLDLQSVKRISLKIANNYKRTFLQGGEILITVRGTLGGVVVVPETCKGYNISREVAMLALVDPSLGPIVAFLIASIPLQNWLLRRTKGIAYTGINIATLKQLPIPIPPTAEQQRIVKEVDRRLSIAEELEDVVAANLKRAERLRQSILKCAFSGRLVPQDPADGNAVNILQQM